MIHGNGNGFCEVCLAETSWSPEEGFWVCDYCGQEVDSLLDLQVEGY